jgi:SRSO17 transposase
MVMGMGRPERRSAIRHYLTGLLLDGERKSVQPMAARLASDAAEADALRQRLQDCVSLSPWSDEEMLRRLALKLDHEMAGIEAFVTDDTGFAKKGKYSVGVARQYSGTLGRTDNCQVAVSLHLAGAKGSGCIAMRVYLPEGEWVSDKERRDAAGVPKDESGELFKAVAGISSDITVLFIEHDMDVALGIADQVTVLHQGKIILEATPEVVRSNSEVREVYFGNA